MYDSLKRFFSLFTDKPIDKGLSFTNDSDVKLDKVPCLLDQGQPVYKNSVLYEFNTENGLFELVGMRRTEKRHVSYKLRCNKTGELFTVPNNMFRLLFKKHSRQE